MEMCVACERRPWVAFYWEVYEERVCSQRCLADLRDQQAADLREDS